MRVMSRFAGSRSRVSGLGAAGLVRSVVGVWIGRALHRAGWLASSGWARRARTT